MASTRAEPAERPADEPRPSSSSSSQTSSRAGTAFARSDPPSAGLEGSRRGPLAVAPGAQDDLRRRLVVLTFARLAVAVILLVVTLVLSANGSGDHAMSGALRDVVLAIFVASIGYALVLSRGRHLRALAVVQIGLDLAAWTATVYVTGGPASPMSFFFVLSTLTAALVLGAGAARVTAGISIVVYGALAIAMTGNVVRPLASEAAKPPLAAAELAFQIVINVVGTLAVAYLGSSLATRLSRAGGALARVEASRAALSALYEDVVRSIPSALLTCAPDGTIDGANPGAAALLAVPVDALLGTPVQRWLPFLPTEPFRTSIAPQVGDEVLEVEGKTHRVTYRAAPLYDRAGQARGGLVVLEDRSDVESLRESMQRSERLAELGRLAAGMAHEIRNPLGAISGCVELVREGTALGAEDRELLATVLAEVARLNSLVTDMLAYARPRPPERVTTDLAALAREVCTLAGSSPTGVRIALAADERGEVPAAVDPDQVRQVLWNLVRNAVQASPAGGVVDVRVARGARTGEARLTVADRGRGIAVENREKVFRLFDSDRARGTGLGLAIVRQIVEAHGATIDVRAREGGGSEFEVAFGA